MEAIAFLASPIARRLAVGAVLALILGFGAVQTVRLNHAKQDLEAARAALYVPDAAGHPTQQTWKAVAQRETADHQTCEASLSTTLASLDAQNAAVDALKAETAKRTAAAAQALAEGRAKASAAEAAANRILAAHPQGDLCARMLEAERLITENSR